MTDLMEMQKQVDIKIADLRQQAHFALNKYDYHHKNDELEIIEAQTTILNQVASTCTRFLNEMEHFNETLLAAKQLSSQLEQLVQSQSQQNERQHETSVSMSTATTPQQSTKGKSKDTSKKRLFPPA